MTHVADWCPTCRERTALVDEGTCLFCDAPLEFRRRIRRRRRAGKLTDVQLRALHRAYVEQGLSINQLAKQIHSQVGYRSHHSAAVCISDGWKRLGLPARDRIEAVKLASTKHGLAPKHGPRPGYGTYKRRVVQGREDQPRCDGVTPAGTPCSRPAMYGSRWCVSHDPERQARTADQLASMRARSRRHTQRMLDVEPFAAWLRQLHAELGTWSAVAEHTGLSRSIAHRCSRGRGTSADGTRVGEDLVRRAAAAAGTSAWAIYPPEQLAA